MPDGNLPPALREQRRHQRAILRPPAAGDHFIRRNRPVEIRRAARATASRPHSGRRWRSKSASRNAAYLTPLPRNKQFGSSPAHPWTFRRWASRNRDPPPARASTIASIRPSRRRSPARRQIESAVPGRSCRRIRSSLTQFAGPVSKAIVSSIDPPGPQERHIRDPPQIQHHAIFLSSWRKSR
jgi:hypothetical protein